MGFARTVGTGFAWTTAGVMAGKVVGFANIFLILSQLSVYEYGVTELVFSVVSTVGLFLLPGLAATIVADLGVERARKEYGRMNALFSEFFLMNMVLGVCAWAVLFFGSTAVAEWSGNVLIDKFFKIVSFSFLISPFRSATTMLATIAVRYADQSFFGPLEEAAKGMLLIFFFFALDRGADGLLWATVLAPIAVVVLYAPRTLSAYREFSHASPVDQQPIWAMLREHRKWSVASTYANTLGKNLRLWLIKILLGTEAVGLFAFASGIFAHATSIANLQAVLTPIVPRYVERRELLARILVSSVKYQFALSLLALAVCLAATPLLVEYVFPHYAPALALSLIMLFALVPNGIGANLTPVFVALKEQRTLLLSIAIRIGSMLIFMPACIWLWGLNGVGFEVVLTMFITTLERLMRIWHMLPISVYWRSVFGLSDPIERQLVKEALERTGLFAIIRYLRRP